MGDGLLAWCYFAPGVGRGKDEWGRSWCKLSSELRRLQRPSLLDSDSRVQCVAPSDPSLLEHAEWQVRSAALWALGRAQGEVARAQLGTHVPSSVAVPDDATIVGLLRDAAASVRLAACRRLRTLGADTRAAACALLADQDGSVRLEAVSTLKLGFQPAAADKCVAGWQAVLEDADVRVRLAAAEALPMLPAPPAPVCALLGCSLLRDPDPRLRRAAVVCFGVWGH